MSVAVGGNCKGMHGLLITDNLGLPHILVLNIMGVATI